MSQKVPIESEQSILTVTERRGWETEGVAVFVRGRDAVWGGTSTFWILRFSFLFYIRYPKKRCEGNKKFEVRHV